MAVDDDVGLWGRLTNQAMARKLHRREAINVGPFWRSDGVYHLMAFVEDKDYCDASTEEWIWSIGKDKKTGEILAAKDGRFYQNPDYECLWLR